MKHIFPLRQSAGADILFTTRALRGFCDGMISLVLRVYLTAIGFSPFQIGVLATAMLMGSAVFILAMGSAMRSWSTRALLVAGAGLMALPGVIFPSVQSFWPLLAVAFLGTINPSTGDSSLPAR